MSDDRNRRADALFEAVLEVGPEARREWLAARVGDDQELLREVEELLAAHEIDAGILDAGILDAGILDAGVPDAAPSGGAAGSPAPEGSADRRIGPYRVLGELGRGGMGVVYLAERDDGQFRRRVAIKLLRASPDADDLRRRFRAERQILASLAHPNIAQLLDGGVTDGHLPYLVMEYVEGLPLTEYCDRHRLSIARRLELFRNVCAAVHHAHRNLVLHRDLKPSNILVNEEGQVKLLDFGIAKLLNPALGEGELPVTRTGFRMMTPEYASPEQVRGEPLSTASDIYALGVVLYELLTGRRPYELTTRSPGEVAKVVCGVEAPRPSAAVTRAAEEAPDGEDWSPAAAGAARDTSSEGLRRQLRGDLDAIAAMTLRKEPGGRYGSADLLSADIQRYLEGLPVLAHRGSRRYRFAKLLRRHRVEAAAAAVVALSLLAGTGAALWQGSVARVERDRAQAARAETEEALAQSEEVAGFLMSLFQASDPEEALGDTITAQELLRRGLARADELEGRPLVQARMLEVVGRVYSHLGEYAEARPLLLRSLALREAVAGEESPEIVASLAELGELHLATGELAEADSVFRRALSTLRREPSAAPEGIARGLVGVGRVRQELGKYAEAEAVYREALEVQRAALGEAHPEVVATMSRLATVLHSQGDYNGAEELLLRTLALREGMLGEAHPDVAANLIQLATVYSARDGRYDRAEELHRRALEIRRRVYGDEHPAVAKSLISWAGLLRFQGKHAEAEPLFRQGLELQRKLLGPRHTDVAGTTNSLALLLLRTDRLDEAESLFRESAAVYEEKLGADHHFLATVIGNLGRVALARGDLEGAEAHFRDALARRVRALGPEHPFTSASELTLADLLERKGAYAEAEALYRRVLAAYERRPDTEDEIREVHRELSELYEAWGRPEAARHHEALPTTDPSDAE